MNNKKGFSLMETIIYIAIVGFIVTSLVAFGISVSNSRNKTYVMQEVQANTRVALGIISEKIRASTGVNVSGSVFNTDPGILSLEIPAASKNPTVIDLNTNDGVLRITEGVLVPVSVTSDKVKVTDLIFTNLTQSGDRENIKVSLTLEYNDRDSGNNFDYTQSIETVVGVRQ